VELRADDPVDGIARSWLRERPGTPVEGIGIITRIWHIAKLVGTQRRRVLAEAGADTATLDLLAVLRRAGEPYRLTTRELAERTLVTPGAISQRLARAERDGLVTRQREDGGSRAVLVSLTPAGHELVERLVDRVLGSEFELLGGLSPAQRATLTELLRILLDDLHDRLGDTPRPWHVGASDPD
jgi:DNA-binding MarR family transcriptional regulator